MSALLPCTRRGYDTITSPMSIPLRHCQPAVSDRRVAALGGIVGPVGFVGAWIASAAITSMPYSSIDDAISRLAAVGADTRWLMTAGMVTFGVVAADLLDRPPIDRGGSGLGHRGRDRNRHAGGRGHPARSVGHRRSAARPVRHDRLRHARGDAAARRPAARRGRPARLSRFGIAAGFTSAPSRSP